MSWSSRVQARATWPDAPVEDKTLDRLLEAAHYQCVAFAPLLGQDALIPGAFVEAEVLQARELWSAARRDGDLIGEDTAYAVRARPLTATVRSLLRPPPPRRAVG